MIEWLREWAANYVATVFTSRNVITLQGYFADEEVANTLRGFINWLERTGATPWRSVEDGLPEQMVTVLLLEDEMVLTGHRDLLDNFWQHDSEGRDEWTVWPTHWMPLPPLPKEKP